MANLIYTYKELIIYRPLSNSIETSGYHLAVSIRSASNYDNKEQLSSILTSFREINRKVYLVAYHRLRVVAKNFSYSVKLEKVNLLELLGYLHMLKLTRHSRGVISDSCGIQKEAFLFGAPCITI